MPNRVSQPRNPELPESPLITENGFPPVTGTEQARFLKGHIPMNTTRAFSVDSQNTSLTANVQVIMSFTIKVSLTNSGIGE